MTKPTIDEQITRVKRRIELEKELNAVDPKLDDVMMYEAILASLEELKRIREVHVPEEPTDVSMLRSYASLGIGWNVDVKPTQIKSVADYIDTLRDLLKRETEECQRQTRENFRLARLHEEAERQLATRKSNEIQKRMAEWMKGDNNE